MNKKMKTEKQMMKLPVYAGILFSVLEIMMALYANSQAVLMDSIYDFAEAIVLGLIIFLIPLFYKPVSERKPFGYAQVRKLTDSWERFTVDCCYNWIDLSECANAITWWKHDRSAIDWIFRIWIGNDQCHCVMAFNTYA